MKFMAWVRGRWKIMDLDEGLWDAFAYRSRSLTAEDWNRGVWLGVREVS